MKTHTNSICPRCLGPIPNKQNPGSYPGALSRTDNVTEICSGCGQMEALEDLIHGGHMPQLYWSIYEIS